MSVTRPTLKLPLDELDELEEALLLELLELVLDLLLLPHAASASADTTSSVRPKGLNVLPVTGSPFIRTEGATLVLEGEAGQYPLTWPSCDAQPWWCWMPAG